METIHLLRKKGYKVRVIHYRYFGSFGYLATKKGNANPDEPILSQGGKTHIDITSPDGKTVSGEAICSVEDTFDRRLGNKIALGRALKQLKPKNHSISNWENEGGK